MASKIPVSKLLDVFSAGREADKGLSETVRVAITIDPAAPRDLVEQVRDCFLAERLGGVVSVAMLDGSADIPGDVPDVGIVVCGGTESLTRQIAGTFVGRRISVACVCEAAVQAPSLPVGDATDKYLSVVAAQDEQGLRDKLATWLVGATDKGRAFAANFPFCREAEVRQLVRACALENAAVGAINLVPGSDLPVMTVNQARLALDIAAAYGHGLEASRVPELAGVAGAGFVYRAIARSVVGLVPGIGWLLRAGMGYAGTVATANAVKARFDAKDAPRGLGPLDALLRRDKGTDGDARAGVSVSGREPSSGVLAVVNKAVRTGASRAARPVRTMGNVSREEAVQATGKASPSAAASQARPAAEDSREPQYLIIDDNGLVGQE